LPVLGIDNNGNKVRQLQEQGYEVIEGDAVDSDFWEKLIADE
jgi:Trk K+ transport system NAD-binding subunit